LKFGAFIAVQEAQQVVSRGEVEDLAVHGAAGKGAGDGAGIMGEGIKAATQQRGSEPGAPPFELSSEGVALVAAKRAVDEEEPAHQFG
jgi:hypothetical protein